MRAGHVSWRSDSPYMAHPRETTLPAFRQSLRVVRREPLDVDYGDSDGHSDGYRSEPPPLSLAEDALVCGLAIAALLWVAAMAGGLR